MADEQVTQDTAAIAKRCMEDAEYAQNLLDSGEHPEIRDALLADIAANSEVQGFLNPCPLPPRWTPVQANQPIRTSPAYFTQPQWNTFSFANLNTFAFGR